LRISKTGLIALVVQDPLEIISKFLFSSSLMPKRIVLPLIPSSSPLAGAVIMTFFAPA